MTKSVSESKVVGDLTIKGITNEETFDVEFNGVSKNPMDGSQEQVLLLLVQSIEKNMALTLTKHLKLVA